MDVPHGIEFMRCASPRSYLRTGLLRPADCPGVNAKANSGIRSWCSDAAHYCPARHRAPGGEGK